jgi:cytolysin (calcineurin-like family phosphatase)
MKAKLILIAGIANLLCLNGNAGVILDLDASKLPAGEVSEAADQVNAGKWKANTPFKIESTEGTPALVLDGAHKLTSDFPLPAGFEKSPFTVEVWAMNPAVDKMETVLTFAPEKGGPGTEFSFSSGSSAGAFRSGFKATTPFRSVPSPKVWHHLAWVYGADGMLRVFVDGELNVEAKLGFNMGAGSMVHIGASNENEGKGLRRGFTGAIARVRVQNTALTQAELRQGAGIVNAFSPSPASGITTTELSASLSWQPGLPEVASYVLYAGIDSAAVQAGQAGKPTTKPEFGPLPLKVGTQYFWRVAQLDKAGKVLSPGAVWTFTADKGLASGSAPRHNDSNVALTLNELKWVPGKYASKQKVFFGTTAEELEAATKPAAEVAATAASCPMPTKLTAGTRYFWRVDTDNGQQPASRGTVWTFRTQDTRVRNNITFFAGSDTHYGRENNAAINRMIIDEMNALPGIEYPASVGGGKVETPRGVVLNGDLLDEGFNQKTGPETWAEFCRDYGLTGADGRLCFPVFEGFGNHDGGPTKSFVRAGIKERNKARPGLTRISDNGLHYSWDWDDLHLSQLNLFGGSDASDVKGVNGPEHDPELSLEFLKMDLEKSLGKTGKPLIAFQHFGWLGGMSEWWTMEAKERYFEAVKDYNVLCLINGHSHGTDFLPWHDLMTIHDGATARGESDSGDFLVVHVTDTEVIVAQRKLGSWGMAKRIPRKIPAAK